MLATAPARPERHAYVEGVHTRTGSDGRVYRLCRVCDDRANAWPHRGYRQKPLTKRERSEHHRFDPSQTVFLDVGRGHKTAACLVCGKAKRATEHGGITNPLPPVEDTDYVAPTPIRRTTLRAIRSTKVETPPPVRVLKSVERMPAELVQAALALDHLLALPDDLVDWRLRMRLRSARDLMPIPVFPTLDARLTPEVAETVETPPTDNLAIARTPTPVPAANPLVARGVLAGIRNDRLRELTKRAVADGWSATMTGSGHLALDKGGTRLIASTTMGDGRRGHSWGNLRAQAKRAGIDVAGL
jgi:hypothetical protein